MLRKLWVSAVATGVLAGVLFSTNTALAQAKVEESLALAQETGRPILVVISREACGNCQRLKSQVESNPALQATIAEFVCLPIDCDNERGDFGAWAQKYPPTSEMLPLVFVVTAQGQELLNTGGGQVGNGFNQVLTEKLWIAAQQSQQLAAALENGPAAANDQPAPAEEPQEAVEPAVATEDRPAAGEDDTQEETPPVVAEAPAEPREMSRAQLNRRLDGWLRMARTFSDSRPEKTREYVSRIIDAAPDSPQAAQAQALLNSLN